ncbi:hypothetical protein ACFRDV_42845 [Streptomyces fagopyri]|uniref:hypothetical protein n=1 Tax=Streptomyces fagopyri TaxID=2662397 RepID=UPI0036C8214A
MAVWEADRIFFTAGHNLFKQAPRLGRALASAAMAEELEENLRPAAALGQPRCPPNRRDVDGFRWMNHGPKGNLAACRRRSPYALILVQFVAGSLGHRY